MKKIIEPIKSTQEADKVFDYLVQTAVDVVKIDKVQAAKRIRNLLDSNVLDGLTPDNPLFQMRVDKYMFTPVD